jgi:hypothetical protein
MGVSIGALASPARRATVRPGPAPTAKPLSTGAPLDYADLHALLSAPSCEYALVVSPPSVRALTVLVDKVLEIELANHARLVARYSFEHFRRKPAVAQRMAARRTRQIAGLMRDLLTRARSH